MYPLLLKAPVKDYLWGGQKLKTEYGFECESEIAAEAWVLSCHKDGTNTVIGGEFDGKTLTEVLEIWGDKALGERAKKFPYFPILIKLIDAKQKLSIQVHPNDEYALKNEGEYGKTEMWYVVDCDEGAQLIYGFTDNISTEEFEERINNNTLTDVCNFVPVHKGDVFFISAGTLHAIGKGILIAEVQQNSNTTYRVSDYGRLGADGKPRELHLQKAVDVTLCEKPSLPYGQVGKVTANGEDSYRELASCDLFKTGLISLKKSTTINTNDSFMSLVVLDGIVNIQSENAPVLVAKKGDSVFLPAGFSCKLTGQAEILSSYV